MTYTKVRDALRTVKRLHKRLYHYFVSKQDFPYCWWAEDSAGDILGADNNVISQTISGRIHYLTLEEYDDTPKKIEAALNAYGISWRLMSIQSGEINEDVVHYEWRFTVEGW